jgi:hypothetical protein
MLATKALLGTLLMATVVLAQTGSDVVSGNNITPAEFERLHKEIRPRPGEASWSEISWMYDLHKARALAAETGKPLCVWRMAGDPTGVC